MKLYKSFLLVAAVAGLFSSCSEDGYWDAYDTKSTTTYSFAQSANNFTLLSSDTLPDIKVTVNRNTNKGNVTLPLDIKVNSNIITADTNVVVFEDGKYTAEFALNVNEEAIVMGNEYTAEVSFLVDSLNFFEHNYSISGNNKFTLNFIKDYTWIDAGSGILASGITGAQTKISFQKASEYTDDADNGYYRFAYSTGNYIRFYLDADGNALYIAPGIYKSGYTDGGAAVELYYDPTNYPQYCSFTNEGNLFTWNNLLLIGNTLYIGGDQFLWQTGWPGE